MGNRCVAAASCCHAGGIATTRTRSFTAQQEQSPPSAGSHTHHRRADEWRQGESASQGAAPASPESIRDGGEQYEALTRHFYTSMSPPQDVRTTAHQPPHWIPSPSRSSEMERPDTAVLAAQKKTEAHAFASPHPHCPHNDDSEGSDFEMPEEQAEDSGAGACFGVSDELPAKASSSDAGGGGVKRGSSSHQPPIISHKSAAELRRASWDRSSDDDEVDGSANPRAHAVLHRLHLKQQQSQQNASKHNQPLQQPFRSGGAAAAVFSHPPQGTERYPHHDQDDDDDSSDDDDPQEDAPAACMVHL